MSSENTDERKIVNGLVTEALPNTMFRVRLDDNKTNDSSTEIIAYLAGKMRMHRIKVLIGDKVELLLDPYGGKARIVKRLRVG